ncbi:MAG: enoyl-CoA hydratase/isomerase family protein [Bacteroidetes bacterium]|nr:enoyl-CoA hydratase/isomerase family protein [Bacteroidota bacterium]
MINFSISPDGIAQIEWNLPGGANILNAASVTAFSEALEKALANESVKGIIVTSAKDSFIVGGDLKALYALSSTEEVLQLGRAIHKVFRRMELGGKPVVAAINGMTLGGGMELCLACHHRIAVNSPAVQLGFPEVTLGLFPGAGGTQRLPRLIGLQPAVQPLLLGRNMDVKEAKALGIVGTLVNSQEELIPAAKEWILKGGKALQPWDVKGFKTPGADLASVDVTFFYAGAAGMVRQQGFGNYPAPNAILSCLYEGLLMNIDEALELELRYFAKVALSKQAKHMIRTLWFSMNKAKAGIARPGGFEYNPVKKLGILGAGMMGAGIAYASAKVGISSVLKDTSMESADKGKDYSRKLLAGLVEKGRSTPEKSDKILSKIHPTGDASDLKDCDLIVEAVFEDRALKARVTQEAEAQMAVGGVFASNTSTLPITGLAEASKAPENFIGLHFFSPVDKMQLVEVIVGKQTGDYALAKSIDYVLQIKKVPIVVNDSRGFFTSRIFKIYVTEGFELLAQGVKPALIENAAKAAGMPVGPLAVADEVSIELLYKIFKQTEADGISQEGPAKDVIFKMVETLDRKGKKEGKGFYDYPEGGKKTLWKGLSEIFPPAAVQPDVEDVKKRLLHLQALESMRCLEEGVLRSVEDADIGSILGWGFPPYTGGVLSYIDFVGVPEFVSDCEGFVHSAGKRFTPTEKLKQLAQTGGSVYPKA